MTEDKKIKLGWFSSLPQNPDAKMIKGAVQIFEDLQHPMYNLSTQTDAEIHEETLKLIAERKAKAVR